MVLPEGRPGQVCLGPWCLQRPCGSRSRWRAEPTGRASAPSVGTGRLSLRARCGKTASRPEPQVPRQRKLFEA